MPPCGEILKLIQRKKLQQNSLFVYFFFNISYIFSMVRLEDTVRNKYILNSPKELDLPFA